MCHVIFYPLVKYRMITIPEPPEAVYPAVYIPPAPPPVLTDPEVALLAVVDPLPAPPLLAVVAVPPPKPPVLSP
jgi:hypothetical protein